MNTNQVTLIGYVGQHMNSATCSNGNKRISIRLATHMFIKRKDGTRTIKTIWHDVIAWGRIAAYAERNFVKGSRILVQGIIEYRTYLDNKEHQRYITEIRAASLMNLDR